VVQHFADKRGVSAAQVEGFICDVLAALKDESYSLKELEPVLFEPALRQLEEKGVIQKGDCTRITPQESVFRLPERYDGIPDVVDFETPPADANETPPEYLTQICKTPRSRPAPSSGADPHPPQLPSETREYLAIILAPLVVLCLSALVLWWFSNEPFKQPTVNRTIDPTTLVGKR
jgi:hypothetical protein